MRQDRKWIAKWDVESSSSYNTYVVSVDENGEYACSCPRWKFHREECKHIRKIRSEVEKNDSY